jgi:energy-coupling factor transport system ATP-binding protein
VATALIAAPSVLILDEPTFGQDAKTWSDMVSLLGELRDQNTAIAIVTHDQQLIDTLADEQLQLLPLAGSLAERGEDVSDEDQSRVGASSTHTEKRAARIVSVNPLAKIAAAAIISLSLIFSLDWVSASVAVVLELALLFWAGLAPKKLLRTVAPLMIAASLTALTIMLYGQQSGTTYVQFLLINVSDGSLELALATFLRVLAIALPAVVLLATVDPTDLADALEQHTRWSPRFILGALVAFRLLTLIAADWRLITRARRARGLGDAPALARFWRQTFALLVLSMRRADKLSTAMQARGFGGLQPRSWSRTSTVGLAEWMLVAISLAIALASVSLSVITGNWNFIFGGLS